MLYSITRNKKTLQNAHEDSKINFVLILLLYSTKMFHTEKQKYISIQYWSSKLHCIMLNGMLCYDA